MFVGTLPPVSNRAGWQFVREIVDDDTDDPIDLSNCEIVVEARDPDCGDVVLSATTNNGKISIVDTGVFQVSFTADDMRALCPSTYRVGCTVKNGDSEPEQLIIGNLPVLDGIVS